MKQELRLLFSAALAGVLFPSVNAAPHSLSTGVGDGSVTVGVDGFGSFGSSIGVNATDAFFDPIGITGPIDTTYESSLAIRFGGSGARSWLSTGMGASLANPAVTGGTTSGTSGFTFGGLSFFLTQSIASTPSGGTLTQSYLINNTGGSTAEFEIIRYLDGDLGSSLSDDGGGRIFLGSSETLFETDMALGTSSSSTFVGITGGGGTIPGSGRYEVDSFSGLRSRIASGTALDDLITGDGLDPDQFIDVGPGYDVTLALRNVFSIEAGGFATYTTHTIFGEAAPDEVVDPGSPVPEPSTIISGAALAALAGARWLRRKS